MPGESATKTKMRDSMSREELEALKLKARELKGHGPWSNTDLLLAEIADRLAWVRHAVLQANDPKGKSPFDVHPIPRPGVEQRAPKSQFVVPDADGDEAKFGTDLNVVTEDRIEKLRKLREMRGAPD